MWTPLTTQAHLYIFILFAVALSLPRLRADQWAIATHPAKIKIVACGRRWGKTVLDFVLALATVVRGGHVAYVVPEYKNGRALWRSVEQALAPLAAVKLCAVNKSERTATFINGGFFGIYSADNPDSIRSEAFDLVLVDEGPYIKESVYLDVIYPTLADRDGSLVITGTPKGKNWVYRLFVEGKQKMNGEIASWNAPSRANPNPNIRKAYDKAKQMVADGRMSERTFRQEWNAEFLEDSGDVFNGVDLVCTGKQGDPVPGHFIVGGLDWGQVDDYSVLSLFDVQERRQVALYRFNGMEWKSQRARIVAYCKQWNVAVLRPEKNSIGGPNTEELINELYEENVQTSVSPFVTTNQSKVDAVDALALAINNGSITLLDDEAQRDELKSFARGKTPNGATVYGAPSGMHDDIVMADAIAWSEVSLFDPAGGVH